MSNCNTRTPRKPNRISAREHRQRNRYAIDFLGLLYKENGENKVPVLMKPDRKSDKKARVEYPVVLKQLVNEYLDQYYKMRFEREEKEQQSKHNSTVLQTTGQLRNLYINPQNSFSSNQIAGRFNRADSNDSAYVSPNPSNSCILRTFSFKDSLKLDNNDYPDYVPNNPSFNPHIIESIITVPTPLTEKPQIDLLVNELNATIGFKCDANCQCHKVPPTNFPIINNGLDQQEASSSGFGEMMRQRQVEKWNEIVTVDPEPKPNLEKRKATSSLTKTYNIVTNSAENMIKRIKYGLRLNR